MAHAIIFDEKNRSASITHKELAQTIELGNAFGELHPNVPVKPGVLLEDMCNDIVKYSGLTPTVSNIIIREPYCQVNRAKLKEEKDLELGDYLIRRLVARIDIPLTGFIGTKDEMNASIAMSYLFTDNHKGIQVGFGENVHICENMCMFGGFQFSTYGTSKVGFEDGMQLMRRWLQNMVTVHDQHLAIIEKFKAAKVHKTGFQRIIGSLFEKAVRHNNNERGVSAPLNQTEIADMVREGLPVLQKDEEHLTGWEILNWGTAILKPNTSDMVNLIRDTSAFNSFLANEFKIPITIDY